MRACLLFFLTLDLLRCSVFGAQFQAVIQKIDGSSITISRKGALTTYRIRPDTTVILNGQNVKLSELKAGMSVNVSSNDPQVATRIIANGGAPIEVSRDTGPNVPPTAPPATLPPAATRMPNASPFGAPVMPASLPKDGTREITLKMTVPGADCVKIQNGVLWLEHVSAMHHGMPDRISINDESWKPEWQDRLSSQFTNFRPPLASFADNPVAVTKLSGRTEIKTERPSEANGYLLKITVTDTPVGDGEYVIHIKW